MTMTPQHVNTVRSACSLILRVVAIGMVLWFGFAASRTAFPGLLRLNFVALGYWEFRGALIWAVVAAVLGALSEPLCRWIIVFPDSHKDIGLCAWGQAVVRWALRAVAVAWTAWYLQGLLYQFVTSATLGTPTGWEDVRRFGAVHGFAPLVLILVSSMLDKRLARWAAPRMVPTCPRCGHPPTPGGSDTCPECGLQGAFSDAQR